MVQNKYLARILAATFRRKSKKKHPVETEVLEITESFQKLLDSPQASEPLKAPQLLHISQLFQIPEILHAILREVRNLWWFQSDRTILACIFVNRLWNSESNRLLWECCGGTFRIKNCPTISHLIKIPPDRQQMYANHIRILRISNQKHNSGMMRWEGQAQAQLNDLSFPRLEELMITSPDYRLERFHDSLTAPITYLQPRLKTLVIWNHKDYECVVKHDRFFDALSRQSKNLREFRLYSDYCPVNAPASIISNVFRDMTALRLLTLRTRAMANMSSEAFLILSRLPSLTEFEINLIKNDWVEQLELKAFPALKRLKCGIDSYGLEQLLKSLPELQNLSVRDTGSSDILGTIARAGLARLGCLEVDTLSDVRANVHDLFVIAENTTLLWWLMIPSGETQSKMIMDGLDDARLQELVKHLPHMVNLQLLPGSSKLTERSLIALGSQCPKLYHCALAAHVDYKKLIQQTPPKSFTQLERLEIVEPDEGDRIEVELRDAEYIAEELVKLMPRLKDPILPAHPNLSETLRRLIGEG